MPIFIRFIHTEASWNITPPPSYSHVEYVHPGALKPGPQPPAFLPSHLNTSGHLLLEHSASCLKCLLNAKTQLKGGAGV